VTHFNRIVVVGLGLIGGSLAAAIRKHQPHATLVGVDRAEVLEIARRMNLIHAGYSISSLADTVPGADLIVLAAPVRAIMTALEIIGACVGEETLVTDVGSTKAAIMTVAKQCLPRRARFLGGHPFTGAEHSGISNANPDLFLGSPYALVEPPEFPATIGEAFLNLLQRIGSRPYFTNAETHDKLAATISHLPQVVAVALMQVAGTQSGTNAEALQLAGRGFRDMTRIAMSPYDIWSDILATNSDNIALEIDRLIGVLSQMRKSMNSAEVATLFRQGARLRSELEPAYRCTGDKPRPEPDPADENAV